MCAEWCDQCEAEGRVVSPLVDLLAAALRQCQVPADWPMAWPDGTSEGTPWVDEALAAYEAALNDGSITDSVTEADTP
jgi:hypothetical protein